MNPVIGEIWSDIQYNRKVRILRLMRGEPDASNLRVVYEYLDASHLFHDTVENFTDNFERATN
jgi:hypothetical protein